MSKRKYSYLIYKDGKKEKILNWFYAISNQDNIKIVVFTQSGTYLYVNNDTIICPSLENPLTQNPCSIHRYPYAFYKLKGGVHNIDVCNSDIWYTQYDIDRMEIMMD